MTDKTLHIRLVIFDFDGTLASSFEGIYACMSEALCAHGFSRASPSQVRLTIGMTLADTFRKLCGSSVSKTVIPELIQTYRHLYNERGALLTTLFPGTLDTLRVLHQRGLRMIVVSNKGHNGLHSAIERLGISRYLGPLLGADDVSYRKPDGRLYEADIVPIADDCARDQVLVVGDTELDILFAQSAGLKSCWASYGYGDTQRCRTLNPDITISSVAELPRWITPGGPSACGSH